MLNGQHFFSATSLFKALREGQRTLRLGKTQRPCLLNNPGIKDVAGKWAGVMLNVGL
jgi:hypothetical protein